jgi:hypothetical protein
LVWTWRFTETSIRSIARDGIGNALFLGYRESAGFLSPWQQSISQSFAPPLWTLSIEFYGSLAVLLLCSCARQGRTFWGAAVILATIITFRSAYLCFVVGHLLANWQRAEKPALKNSLLPFMAVALGVFLCVRADLWQFEWLRTLSSEPAWWLFPGQSAAKQQKAFGATFVLGAIGAVSPVVDQKIAAFLSNLPGALADSRWPGGPDLPEVEWSNRARTGPGRGCCSGDQHCFGRSTVVFPHRSGRAIPIRATAREIVWADHGP